MNETPKQVQKNQRWRLRANERHLFLALGDLLAGFIALFVALYFWANSAGEYLGPSVLFLFSRPQPWFYLLPLAWMLLIAELYDPNRAANLPDTIRGIGMGFALGLALYAVVYFSSDPESLPRLGVAVFLLSVSVFTLVWRSFYIRIFTRHTFMHQVLIVGGGRAGRTLLEMLRKMPQLPFHVVGIVDDDPDKIGTELEGVPILSSADKISTLVSENQITEIIVAISGEMHGHTFQILLDVQEKGVEISRMQTMYEELNGRVPIFHLEADWILRSFVEQSRVGSFYHLAKRAIDIAGGLVGVLGLVLVTPFVALATTLESGRPVFYTQTRSGQGDRPYEVIKFRTMYQDAEKDGRAQWAQENDERVTKVGRVLRRTHLDELPQFVNVLRGDMSLVGPRPERPELVEHFQQHVPFYRARLLVKPGISGWAQINQDYAANVEETFIKLEYDLYYIKHRSLLLDLLILLRTPPTMLGFRGRA